MQIQSPSQARHAPPSQTNVASTQNPSPWRSVAIACVSVLAGAATYLGMSGVNGENYDHGDTYAFDWQKGAPAIGAAVGTAVILKACSFACDLRNRVVTAPGGGQPPLEGTGEATGEATERQGVRLVHLADVADAKRAEAKRTDAGQTDDSKLTIHEYRPPQRWLARPPA